MTLPAVAAVVPGGRNWRGTCAIGATAIVFVLLLLCLLLLGMLRPAWAEDDDAFTATVKVDTSADSPAKAREAARLEGQRRALAALADKMSGGNAGAKLPKLDDNAITNLVASFEIANERMSSVRYAADMTFHFRPAETQRVLKSAGIAVNPSNAANPAAASPAAGAANPANPGEAAGSKPTLVLPVYVVGGKPVLWEEPNPWRDAWAARPAPEIKSEAKPAPETKSEAKSEGKSPLSLPLGDVGDIGAIDAEKARSGDPAALAAIAKRNGAEDVLVLLATPQGPPDKPTGLDITARRYRQGKLADSHSLSLDAKPGEAAGDLFSRAVTAVAAAGDGNWKKEPGGTVDQLGTLTVSASIAGLDDWVRLRDRLSSLGTIRKIELMSLSRQEAVIEVQYSGSVDQLKASLAERNLDLVRGEPNWRLSRLGAAPK